MRRTVIATVTRHPDGSLSPCLFCADENGTVDEAVSRTLLDLAVELDPQDFPILLEMMTQARESTQSSETPTDCDFTCNDIEVWLRPPTAGYGQMAIRNINYGEEAQKFPSHFFIAAWKHWNHFQKKLEREGKVALVEQRFEITVDLVE